MYTYAIEREYHVLGHGAAKARERPRISGRTVEGSGGVTLVASFRIHLYSDHTS